MHPKRFVSNFWGAVQFPFLWKSERGLSLFSLPLGGH